MFDTFTDREDIGVRGDMVIINMDAAPDGEIARTRQCHIGADAHRHDH